MLCHACGGNTIKDPLIRNVYADACVKKYESFVIAGEEKPSNGSYVFWVDPITQEITRPRHELVCVVCGYRYDVYIWCPPPLAEDF